MTLSSSPLMLSTCAWKDGSHAYSFKIWREAKIKERDEEMEGIMKNMEKETLGNTITILVCNQLHVADMG